jgi:hypothetical protein
VDQRVSLPLEDPIDREKYPEPFQFLQDLCVEQIQNRHKDIFKDIPCILRTGEVNAKWHKGTAYEAKFQDLPAVHPSTKTLSRLLDYLPAIKTGNLQLILVFLVEDKDQTRVALKAEEVQARKLAQKEKELELELQRLEEEEADLISNEGRNPTNSSKPARGARKSSPQNSKPVSKPAIATSSHKKVSVF